MRHFVAAAVRHLKEQTVGGVSLFEAQQLKQLFVHSDNAAQHFKSSKSLHWLSKQILDMGFLSVMWDFGPPGHGKVKPPPFRMLVPSGPIFLP
jgi:hypothetical protein